MLENDSKHGVNVALQRALELADSANKFDAVERTIYGQFDESRADNGVIAKTAIEADNRVKVVEKSQRIANNNFADYRKKFMEENDPVKLSVEYVQHATNLIYNLRADKSREA